MNTEEKKLLNDILSLMGQINNKITQLNNDFSYMDCNYEKAKERMLEKEMIFNQFILHQNRINRVVEELWKRAGSFEND